MTYKPQFDVDLRFGEAAEAAFVHVFLQSRVEVKADRKCLSTGNLAIEYEQIGGDGQRRPSGISISEAAWYAVGYAPGRWLLVETEQLREFARKAIRTGRHKWIGDADEHHNALVPIVWLVTT
jgi:hypothetical protein